MRHFHQFLSIQILNLSSQITDLIYVLFSWETLPTHKMPQNDIDIIEIINFDVGSLFVQALKDHFCDNIRIEN